MRHALTTMLLAGGLLVTGAGTAAAASPWTPYHQDDVLVPAARSTCGFDVQETVVSQAEEYRTLATYPDGSPQAQLFKGDLTMRFTNLSTGVSVVRDLGGTGVFTYNPDGSPASLTSDHGPFGATLPPGSTPATGLFVLDGRGTSVTFHADGTRTYTLGRHGSAENLCVTLS